MYCRYCGSENPEKSKYCQSCGGEISSASLVQRLKLDKILKAKQLYWKVPVGIIFFFILACVLLYAFSSSFRTSFNSAKTTSSAKPSQGKSIDNTQSVIDVTCNNNEGGSGTIFSQDGEVLTNNHVINGASSCLITLPDTTTGQPKAIYTAKPVIIPNLSEQYDLAYLKINGAYTDSNGKIWGKYPVQFPAFSLPTICNKYTPHLGDYVRIYGYPVTSGGYNLTITDGIISSFDDNNGILTSAKIDSGNSGGLAVNKDGCFLGVPSAVVSGNYQNLGVIIPASVIENFANGNQATNPQQSSNANGFDSSCLALSNDTMYKSSSSKTNPEYTATLYNGCSQAVSSVQLVVNFYAANSDSNSAPLDTEYVDSGVTYLGSGDTYNIDLYVNTQINTSVDFTWKANVYSANPAPQSTQQTTQQTDTSNDSPPTGGYQDYGWYMHNGSSMQYVNGNWYSSPQQNSTPTPTTDMWNFSY